MKNKMFFFCVLLTGITHITGLITIATTIFYLENKIIAMMATAGLIISIIGSWIVWDVFKEHMDEVFKHGQ